MKKIEVDINDLLEQVEMLPPLEYSGQTVISSSGWYFVACGETELRWKVVFLVTHY